MSVREILEKAHEDALGLDGDAEAFVWRNACEDALAALDAEGVGLPWVSVGERLPDESQGDLLVYNTKWVDSMAAEDVDENCRGWYWLPLSAIPLPGQSPEPSAGLREAADMIRAWPCVQGCDNGVIPIQVGDGEWEPQQCQFCDERERVLAALRADEEQNQCP